MFTVLLFCFGSYSYWFSLSNLDFKHLHIFGRLCMIVCAHYWNGWRQLEVQFAIKNTRWGKRAKSVASCPFCPIHGKAVCLLFYKRVKWQISAIDAGLDIAAAEMLQRLVVKSVSEQICLLIVFKLIVICFPLNTDHGMFDCFFFTNIFKCYHLQLWIVYWCIPFPLISHHYINQYLQYLHQYFPLISIVKKPQKH